MRVKRPSVLVVDDEPAIVALLTAALEMERISAAGAHGASQACQLFSEHNNTIQVLVTDVLMPDVDGIELAQRIRQQKPEIKVLFVSGYCAAYEAAMRGHDCVPKPFRPADIVAKVRLLLHSGSESQRRARSGF